MVTGQENHYQATKYIFAKNLRLAQVKEKPPIFGMIQRCGYVIIQILPNVRQKTIEPIVKASVLPVTLVYTDEYAIYNRLNDWRYQYESVNHGKGEYAGDDDRDGLHEVHVNTMEGFWSLLRSWFRPHRVPHKKSSLYILAFLNLFIMPGSAAKPCFTR